MGAQIQTKTGAGIDSPLAPLSGQAKQEFSASREISTLLDLPSFDSLSPEQEQSLTKQLGAGVAGELRSLAQESDPELFYAGILHLGRRLQDRDRPEWAQRLYASVAGQASFPDLAKRAKTSLDALEGRGEIGARAEVLFSRFSKDVTDPALIAPMLIGSSVGGIVRGLGLSRLAAAPTAWYSRGFGARFTAGSLAYAAEVPAFVATGRTLRGLSGQAQASWGHDFSTGALSLGAIKVFGMAGKQGLAQIHGVNEWGAIARGAALAKYSYPLVNQVSLFGGLMTSHWTETKLGLRPQVDDATAVTDALASMVSLGAGMRLGQGLLGRGYARKMSELEWRTQSLPKAMTLPSFELPKLSARSTAAASGLGLLLQSNLAHAAEPGRWNSTTLTATLLSSLAVGGGLLYGFYRIRRAYVAPSGPIARLRRLQQDIPTMLPARLEHEVGRAIKLLQESSTGDRQRDAEGIEAASAFLEGSLPRLEPAKRSAAFAALVELVLTGRENFAAPTISILKRNMNLVRHSHRTELVDQVFRATNYRHTDKLLSALFLLNGLAQGLSPQDRQAAFDRALKVLEFQSENLDNNYRLLMKQRVLLRELQSFLEKEHQETLRGLRDELFDLEKKPEGGLIPSLRENRILALREQIKKPPEKSANELLEKYRESSEDLEARHFDFQDAVVQAHKLMELFDETSAYRPPDFRSEFSLRAHMNEPAMQDYLRNGHSYIKMTSSQAITELLAESLLGVKPKSSDKI